MIPIVFGYPMPELFDAADRGEVILGGCIVWGEDPTHRCSACGEDVILDDAREGRVDIEVYDRLVEAAQAREMVTYGELGEMLHLDFASPASRKRIGEILGQIKETWAYWNGWDSV